MTKLTDTILPDEAIASTKNSLAALDALHTAIMSSAQANPGINADTGAGSLYGMVLGVRSRFTDLDESDAKQQMPAPVVELLSKELVPALADVVAELNQLWVDIQAAVEAGAEGQPLVDAYLAKAEDDSSALMRVQSGLEQLQDLAMQAAVDQLSSIF